MRIASSISIQRPGLSPSGYGVWPPRIVHAVPAPERRSAARALPPQRLGDAAQLTLLMAQAISGERTSDRLGAAKAYAPAEDAEPVFAFKA